MDCFHESLSALRAGFEFTCFRPEKSRYRDVSWHVNGASGPRVALMIEQFPRALHPLLEFDALIEVLRKYSAKCTFLFPWRELKRRGMSATVHHFVSSINNEGHQVSLGTVRDR